MNGDTAGTATFDHAALGVSVCEGCDSPSVNVIREEQGFVRDDLEEKRDRARKQSEIPESGPLPSIEDQQLRIDVFVILERAVKFIHADAGPERDRHSRRVSALCDNPAAVIETIEKVLESTETDGPIGKIGTVARRVLSRESAIDREGNP